MAVPTNYQRVGAAYDVSESGVASVYTAYFDGVDDELWSPTIDWAGSTKLSHFSGARCTSSGGYGGFFGNGAANRPGTPGRFGMSLPSLPSLVGEIRCDFGGVSTSINTSSVLAWGAPCVTSAVLDSTTSPRMRFRLSGAPVSASDPDVGGQSFATDAVGIGPPIANGGMSPYKGFVTALCVRGAATDAAIVTSMEKWLAARTPGVTLP